MKPFSDPRAQLEGCVASASPERARGSRHERGRGLGTLGEARRIGPHANPLRARVVRSAVTGETLIILEHGARGVERKAHDTPPRRRILRAWTDGTMAGEEAESALRAGAAALEP